MLQRKWGSERVLIEDGEAKNKQSGLFFNLFGTKAAKADLTGKAGKVNGKKGRREEGGERRPGLGRGLCPQETRMF